MTALGIGGTPIDVTEYWPMQSGTTWQMRTEGFRPPGTGLSTFTLLPEEDIEGILVVPWLITKDSLVAYWWPGEDMTEVFYVVSPHYHALRPLWNTFIWARGDRRINRTTGEEVQLLRYQSASILPPYMLARHGVTLPYMVEAENATGYSIEDDAPVELPPGTPGASWRLGMRWTRRPRGWRQVPILACDYLEAWPGTFAEATVAVRETWYFAREVGMVEIRGTTRFGAGIAVTDPACAMTELEDPDYVTVRI